MWNIIMQRGPGMPGKRTVTLLGFWLILILFVVPVMAQTGGGYDLSWNTVDGGGGMFSTGGDYSVGGTIGQVDAGAQSGGAYGLQGGFWVAAVGPNQLVGHVTWQGRPAQPHNFQELPITLTLKLGANEINYPVQSTDASGYFTVSVTGLNGVFDWRVKGPKYLANSGSVALTGTSITQANLGLMRAGDANNDNLVNVLDFNILKATFGKSSTDAGYDDRADFTGERVINIQDYNLIKLNFGTGGAPPVNFGGGGK
jgi:hypothetical protein